MNLIAKLLCRFTKHKRGKRTGVSSELGTQYRCPRCGAHWNRKVKA